VQRGTSFALARIPPQSSPVAHFFLVDLKRLRALARR